MPKCKIVPCPMPYELHGRIEMPNGTVATCAYCKGDHWIFNGWTVCGSCHEGGVPQRYAGSGGAPCDEDLPAPTPDAGSAPEDWAQERDILERRIGEVLADNDRLNESVQSWHSLAEIHAGKVDDLTARAEAAEARASRLRETLEKVDKAVEALPTQVSDADREPLPGNIKDYILELEAALFDIALNAISALRTEDSADDNR